MRLRDRWRQLLLTFCLGLTLTVTACSFNDSPSPYAQVQEETTGKGAEVAVDKDAQNGSTFNQFFPKQVSGYDVVPSQEKRGLAKYKVNQGGTTVATLSINDTVSNPSAANKYQSSDFQVAGYPAVDQGQNATGLLVNNRYQVKVMARDESLTRDDRIAWLERFDLSGLSQLESAQSFAAPELPKAARRLPRLAPQPAT